jgi:5'-AMP-activated protein kinase catalytic alpha subunit
MEYACGGELFNYIVKKKRLDEQETSFFFSQIISGLEYIHKNNIVHRDLKPENLLLTENNTLKIIDFGLSNQYKSGQTLITPCGSPCYAAPEMIMGKKYAGLSVDIWSTGIILFAMICGYLPFEDKNNDKLYKKILECKLDFPYHVSNTCKDLIKRILTVNPLRRIKLEDIKSHPFMKLETPSSSIILNTQGSSGESSLKSIFNYPLYNPLVLEKMRQLGYNPEDVISNLENNKHNNLTTTYYLLSNKEGLVFYKNQNRSDIIQSFKNNNSPKAVDSPPPEINSMKVNNGNNININISYLDKIGNINININEKKEENISSREIDLRNSIKLKEKEINASNQVNSVNTNNINNKISLNSEKENEAGTRYFTEDNWTSKIKNIINNPISQLNKISYSPGKSARKYKKNWQKSNTSFSTDRDKYSPLNTINVMSNMNKTNLNNSFTPLDLNSYLQTKKQESNNIILPSYILPQVNRFKKIYSKKINKNPVEFYTSRKNYQSSKINTSVTLENSISHRSPSRETVIKSFIPRNTINLINYDNNLTKKNPFKYTHKNSHSLTSDRQIGSKYINNFKSETCTIDLVNEPKIIKNNKKEEKVQVFLAQSKKNVKVIYFRMINF